jgi:hypothetical protein
MGRLLSAEKRKIANCKMQIANLKFQRRVHHKGTKDTKKTTNYEMSFSDLERHLFSFLCVLCAFVVSSFPPKRQSAKVFRRENCVNITANRGLVQSGQALRFGVGQAFQPDIVRPFSSQAGKPDLLSP